MPLQLQVRQTGLEKSIQEGMKKAGRNLKLNLGNTRNIDALSQPLGRLTGKADEFTKSMEAANARVLAFGASVGVIAAVTKGMQELVRTTIEVEKSMANINSILRQTDAQMSTFKDTLFDVARNTEQTFGAVAEAALELSRQGLKAEEVTKRLNDALVLSRLSGLSAADSVSGLTAAINSFSKSGITSAEVLNKISAAAASAAVSDRDLIEGLKRSGAVAVSTGVGFDKLLGIIGALQEKTARGGAVIGNSLKTIFTRIQDVDKLKSLQNLGVQVTDLQGNVLSADKVIENLAPTFAKLDQVSKVNLADNLVGKFQIAPFLSLLEQYNAEVVRSNEIAKTSFGATNEAYERNIALNNTLSAALNSAVINMKELGNTLGEIGVTDNLKNVLGFFNSIAESLQGTLDGEGAGSTFAKGLVKGIGAILSGPGLVLLGAVVTKLAFGFVKFGTSSLKTFFGLNQAAKEHANLQGQITAALLNDSSIRQDILSIENKSISVEEKRKQQAEAIAAAMNAQLTVMKQMQSISKGITPSVAANTKAARSKSAAGGFLPIGAESADIARGVGGAPSSAKPVVIPNFAFGGGKKGTMVANSSEYIVPNYANGGDAIFNQNMASSMGLPANAKKVRAASGYIPNFAQGDPINSMGRYIMLHGEHGKTDSNKMAYYHPETGKYNVTDKEGALAIRVPVHGLTDANKGNTVNEYIKEYEDFAIDQGFKKSRELTKHLPTKQVESAIKSKVNSGAVAGFAGSIYELALASMLTDEEFKNYADQTETSNFDLNLQGQEKLLKLYGIGTKPLFGEVKGRNNPENVASSAAKIHRVMGVEGKKKQAPQTGKLIGKKLSKSDTKRFGIVSTSKIHTITADDIEKINAKTPEGQRPSFAAKTGMFSGFVNRSASGYIPNFADPLQDAIGREQAAGLPVSQIRINQSGKLRNSQNPMGLAVTNTRDEPTGAIPNFAKGKPPEVNLSMRDIGSRSKAVTKSLGELNNFLTKLSSEIQKGETSHEKATEAIKKHSASITSNTKTQEKVNSAAIDQIAQVEESSSKQRDLTGIIFGVQAGMTALAAATEGSTGQIAQLTNIVSEGAAGISSFVFAGEAANDFGESLKDAGKGKLGGFVKGLGSAVSTVGTLFEATKMAGEAFDHFTGVNDAAALGMEKVAASAEKAAIKLSDLDPEGKRRVKFSAEREMSDILRARGDGFRFGFSENDLDFEGFDLFSAGKLEKVLSQAVESTIAAGGNRAELSTKLREISSDRFVSAQEVDETLDFFDTLIDKANEFNETIEKGDILKKLTTIDKLLITSLSDKEFEAAMAGTGKDSAQLSNIRKRVFEGEDMESEVEKQMLRGIRTKAEEKVKDDELAKDKKMLTMHTLSLSLTKNRLKTLIEINKVRLGGMTEAEKALSMGEALNSLSREQKLDLKEKVALQGFDRDVSMSNLDIISKQVSTLEGLKAKSREVLNIEQLMQSALADGKIETDERNKMLTVMSNLMTTGTDLQKSRVSLLLNELAGQKKITDEKRKQLGLELAQERAESDRAAGLKFEDSRSKFRGDKQFREKSSELEEKIIKKGEDARILSVQASNIASVDPIAAQALTASSNQARKEETALRGDKQRLSLVNQFRSMPLHNMIKEFPSAQLEAFGDDSFQKDIRGLSTETDVSKIESTLMSLAEILPNQEGDFVDMVNRINSFSQKIKDSEVATEKNIEALTDYTLTIKQQGAQEVVRSRAVEKFSRAEAADLRRAGLSKIQAKKGELPEDIAREAKMRRSIRQRVTESTDTSLEASDKLKDNLVSASRQFVMNMDEAFRNAISSSDSLGDALLEISKQFLSDITSAYSKKFLNKAFGDVFGENKKATGGFISGGSGNKDDVPAMLMGGEFVMRKSAVQKYGAGFFNALNSGGVQGYASGGSVRQRRDEEGLFRTPSSSSGYISGVSDLMSFATQSPNRMSGDSFVSGGATAAFLDPESARLSMFGRRSSQQFGKVQDAKKQAFDLAVAEMGQMDQARIAGKESSGQFFKDILSAGISAGLGGLGADMFKGNKFLTAASGFGSNLLGTAITGGGASGFGNFGAGYVSSMQESGSKGLFDFLKSLFSNKQATGGMISSSTGVDTVPTMLSGGEFIMNASATKRLGAGNLQALNSGSGGGGDNSQLVGKLDELITATESASGGEINITINSEGKENVKTSEGASEDQKKLSERIKTVVKQVITDEKRLGGQLRK